MCPFLIASIPGDKKKSTIYNITRHFGKKWHQIYNLIIELKMLKKKKIIKEI